MAFAYNKPAAYLETNVRTVVLHELLSDRCEVRDSEIRDIVARAARISHAQGIEPRTWNYALLDYGAYLKKTVPNPSRQSSHHRARSKFEGSRRQKRATLLRAVLDTPEQTYDEYAYANGYDPDIAEGILADLVTEGFLSVAQGRYRVASH
jgi:A/G-specific adenine glycosylase